jgi:anion-transporting  ArsA/GET3 family ATPase
MYPGFMIEVSSFPGKGGVGKSTAAAAYAIKKASEGRTLIVDYDGGPSLARVLVMQRPYPNTITDSPVGGLEVFIAQPIPFTSIFDYKAQGGDIDGYLAQFPGDFGLLPFCDMVTSFYGAPTDIDTVSKFSSLVGAYHDAKERGVEHLVVDVEPTGGLLRMMDSVEVATRSLLNLARPKGMAKLTRPLVMKEMPDVKAFVNGPYMSNVGHYLNRVAEAAVMLINSQFNTVTLPESSPVDEMIELKDALEDRNMNVKSIVVNNAKGEPHEAREIEKVEALGLPYVVIDRDLRLTNGNQEERLAALREMGEKL